MPQPISRANTPLRILGLDVAKANIVLHDSASGRTLTLANTPKALRAGLAAFAGYDLAVCETTGGYECACLEAAFALGLAIHRADAGRVKAFIASHGGRAKTDPIDAAWLARYGADRFASLVAWSPPDPDHEALAEMVRHRLDLVAQRSAAKNRFKAPTGQAVKPLLAKQIQFLTGQIKALERDIARLTARSHSLRRKRRALEEIKGIGPVCASALLALGPELGQLNRKTAASLFGLAPHPRDSGQTSSHRRMRGGRVGLKPLMFLAAMSAAQRHPQLKGFYQRLIEAGKPKKLALAAVSRKLVVLANAVIRDIDTTSPELT